MRVQSHIRGIADCGKSTDCTNQRTGSPAAKVGAEVAKEGVTSVAATAVGSTVGVEASAGEAMAVLLEMVVGVAVEMETKMARAAFESQLKASQATAA